VALLTFDDAYHGSLTLGLSELARRGLPATVFVPPGLLGCEGFWWDRLAQHFSGGLPPTVRKEAFQRFNGRQDLILDHRPWAAASDFPLPRDYRPVTEGELQNAIDSHLRVAFESHTWSHAFLPSLSDQEIRTELERSRRWLKQRGSGSSELLSYPYGATTDSVRRIARELGFDAAFLVQGGRMNHALLASRAFELPRLNVPRGLSKEGLWLWVSGFRSK